MDKQDTGKLKKGSLSRDLLTALTLFAVALSITAAALGFGVYIESERSNRLESVHGLAVTLANMIDGDRLAPYTKRIMEAYDSLPEDVRENKDSEAYRAVFRDIHSEYVQKELIPLTQNFLESNRLANVLLAMRDESSLPGTIVLLVNSTPSKTVYEPGQWDYDPDQADIFRIGEGREDVAFLITHEGGGFACYGTEPVFTSDGELAGFTIVGYFMSDIFSSALRFSVKYLALIVLLAAIMTVLILWRTKRNVVQPIMEIQNGVQLYGKTKDSRAATEELKRIHLKNEIGDMAEAFIRLMVEIDSYTEDVTRLSAEKERIATELSMATRIQANMLPNTFPAFPKRKEFELHASMTPAKEVGGDFYDFFFVDDDHLAMVVADVSGKGIPAALFMMTSRTMLKDVALVGLDPASVLSRVNGMLCENNKDDMFVTVWLGILEISTGTLTYADAGHEKLLAYRDGAWGFLPKNRAPALAFAEPDELEEMPEQYRFRNETIRLKPGDVLLQYTDGVTEATYDVNAGENAVEAMFGEKRLLNAVNELGGAGPEELLKHIRARIDEFVDGGEQFDDITMLGLRYRGTGA